ncbi:MAG: hypothetical protein JST86_00020 [Bacteroidetes bacterium]|nr:hypothetical protein [Bacteroidota bacterium]
MKTTGPYAVLKITHNVLLALQIMITAALFYFGFTRSRIATLSDTLYINYHIAVFIFVAIALWFSAFFFKRKLMQIARNPGWPLQKKTGQYKMGSFVQWILLDAATLLCGVSYYYTVNIIFLVLAVVLMLYFFLLAPVKTKMVYLLGLNPADIEEI